MLLKAKILIRRILLFWSPVILWSLAIYAVSDRTVPKSSEFFWQDFVIKKFAHIVEYGILSIFIYRAFLNEGVDKNKAGVWAIILTTLYGVSDEYHQSFVLGRQSRIRDVVFDFLGAGSAIYLILRYLPKASKRITSLARKLEVI